MGGTSNENNYIQENIFAMQARFDADMPDDREKPRANLYNVVKCLREDAVSVISDEAILHVCWVV